MSKIIPNLSIDMYGELWERIDENTMRRMSDGHVGGWFHGKGLTSYVV
jgi:hypothetical protein